MTYNVFSGTLNPTQSTMLTLKVRTHYPRVHGPCLPVVWTEHKCQHQQQSSDELEMWANAQRDGRPAEYRWRPLFNAAKFV